MDKILRLQLEKSITFALSSINPHVLATRQSISQDALGDGHKKPRE